MHTKKGLMDQLEQAEIDRAGVLLCHFSMKSIGGVEGGADTVLDALSEYMQAGLLVIPSHTWNNVNEQSSVFDVEKTECCIGLLPELFRHRAGVVRSLHPTHSLCALGKGAEELLSGQEWFDTPCAPESSYGMLEKMNAQVLLVGVGFGRNTSIHCIEELADVPNRLTDKHQILYSVDSNGKKTTVPSRRHDNADSNLFVKLEPLMEQRGQLRHVAFGDADTLRFMDRDLFATTLELLRRDIDLFGDDKPIPLEWY